MKNQRILSVIAWVIAILTPLMLLGGEYYHRAWHNAKSYDASNLASAHAETMNAIGIIGVAVTICLMAYLYATTKKGRYLAALLVFLVPVLVILGFIASVPVLLRYGFFE